MTLKSETKQGLAWGMIENFASRGLQFLFGIVLARLLSPDDYGIIAMPLVFLALAQCFIDSGFSSALVRKPELKEEDLSTAFYFNIIVGVVCYGILYFTSPLIADFYNTPILSDLLKVTALATLFNPLCTVQQTILTRKIDFRTQAIISLAAALISGIVGLTMAYNGYGVWSLVFQQVGGYTLRTILLWILCSWRPKLLWSWESFHYLWGFGNKMLASALLNTLYSNVYPIVIGRFFSAKDLGNYTRAQNYGTLPSSQLTGVLQRVTFPVLSRMQNEDDRLAANYRRMLRLSALVVFPIMMMLSAVADPLVRVFLTDKWEGCILYLQIMCFSMMWYPIHAINLNLLQVKGRSDIFFRLEVIKKIIATVVMCITIPNGILWMVSGGIFSSLTCLVVNTYYTGKFIHVGYLVQMRDIFPVFILSLAMWSLIHITTFPIESSHIQLVTGIATGALFFLCCARYFLKRDWHDAVSMLPAKCQSMLM